jgi:outer membrane protein OmpA-like peptidoglycan-associated protein
MNQKFVVMIAVNFLFISVFGYQQRLIAGNARGSSLNSTGSSLTGNVSNLDGLIKDLNGTVSESQIAVPLPSDVLFDYDRADIRAEAIPILKKLQQIIAQSNPERITIEGHTDSDGSETYNLELSQKRAEAVAAWLVNNTKLTSDRLDVKGYGETKPIAENQKVNGEDNPEGRAKNRRVEIIIPQ